MFNHRFFMDAPFFINGVDPSHAVQDELPRAMRLMRFAHDIFGWFEQQPAMRSLKLTCVALPELEKSPLSVRIRHHFTLVGEDGTVPEVEEYALENLPWSQMGAGVFQLSREDEVIQRYLALPTDDALKYRTMMYELAMRIDIAFESFGITHDLGLRSAG